MKAIVLIGAWPIAAWWRGYVASLLWAWFVVPTFALPFISAYQAAGIGLVVSLFSHWPDNDDNLSWEWVLAVLVKLGFYPLMVLALGAFWRWLQWGL